MKELWVAVFEEWKRRYDEEPEWFQSYEAFKAEAPRSYGEEAAVYFEALVKEMIPTWKKG